VAGDGRLGSDGDGDGDGDDELAPARRRAAAAAGGAQDLSTHERRLLRMQERIAELETEAIGDKAWHLRGEVDASRRPVDSALAVDLEFDTTQRAAPAPTEEAAADIEALIKRRVADARFDDVVRVAAEGPERKRRELAELDDGRAQQGLGESYEQDYLKQRAAAAGGAAGAAGAEADGGGDPKQAALRQEAAMLFKALSGKLDALTRFHYAPKPVVHDLTVRGDVAALAAEEVAPLAASRGPGATMRTAREAFAAEAAGEAKAEGELTRDERKARRQRHKRAARNQREAKDGVDRARDAARAAALLAPGEDAALLPLSGRRSAAAIEAAQRGGVLNKDAMGKVKHARTAFGRSTGAFAAIAEGQKMQQAAKAAGGGGGAGGGQMAARSASQLKL